jgi:putative salt-induced outer membrane protein YdiY
VRAIPPEDWLEPRNRTIVNYTQSYGKVSEPGTPTVKTSIIHADVERDEYVTSRVYVFGQAAWDHNFSQGLDLQQSYGGGIGWTAYKTDNQELDFKGSIAYIRQEFAISSQDENLIGAILGQTYHRNFAHGIVLAQGLSVTPSFNVPSAYSAQGNVTLSLPLYKHFNLALGAIDSFLNNPPPGFKKNSFQFTAALAYSIP